MKEPSAVYIQLNKTTEDKDLYTYAWCYQKGLESMLLHGNGTQCISALLPETAKQSCKMLCVRPHFFVSHVFHDYFAAKIVLERSWPPCVTMFKNTKTNISESQTFGKRALRRTRPMTGVDVLKGTWKRLTTMKVFAGRFSRKYRPSRRNNSFLNCRRVVNDIVQMIRISCGHFISFSRIYTYIKSWSTSYFWDETEA